MTPTAAAAKAPGHESIRRGGTAGWASALARSSAVLCMDFALLAAGLGMGVGLHRLLVPHHLPPAPHARSAYFVCALCCLGMMLYERAHLTGLHAVDHLNQIVKGLTGGFLLTILLSFVGHNSAAISRGVLFGWYVANLLIFILLRPRLLGWARRRARHARILVVSEDSAASAALLLALHRAGFVPHRVDLDCDPENLEAEGWAGVALCLPAAADEAWAQRWERRYPQLGLVPPSALAPLGARPVNLHGTQMFVLDHPLSQRFNRMCKRSLDVAGAVVLLLLGSPLLGALALAVRLDSPGPILFRQQRLGRGGRPIGVWKLRTMARDAEHCLQAVLAANPAAREEYARTFKLKRDPRVTRLGRLLRRYSLDELPQLWNVICGDMSLVGPRPIVAAEIGLYGEAYAIVSAVRPGLTGVWQTSGRSDVSYESRLRFDVGYVRNWSIWLDAVILLRTLAAVLLPSAY